MITTENSHLRLSLENAIKTFYGALVERRVRKKGWKLIIEECCIGGAKKSCRVTADCSFIA